MATGKIYIYIYILQNIVLSAIVYVFCILTFLIYYRKKKMNHTYFWCKYRHRLDLSHFFFFLVLCVTKLTNVFNINMLIVVLDVLLFSYSCMFFNQVCLFVINLQVYLTLVVLGIFVVYELIYCLYLIDLGKEINICWNKELDIYLVWFGFLD